jgi:holo-[acyl-carrier protein] synthase
MIFGIGTDLLDARRVESGLARFGDAYARRLLAESEFAACAASPRPARFLAKAFAAKEAFSKACGTGLRAPVTLANLAVVRDELGKPAFQFAPELADWLAARGVTRTHLSLSDEGDFVLAYVILETA